MSNVISTGMSEGDAKAASQALEKLIKIVVEPQLANAKADGADKAIIAAYERDLNALKKLQNFLKSTQTKEV